MEVKVVRKESPIEKVTIEFSESEAKSLLAELNMIKRELQGYPFKGRREGSSMNINGQIVKAYWELAPYVKIILSSLEDKLKSLPKE